MRSTDDAVPIPGQPPPDFPYPVVPNDRGGYDILLQEPTGPRGPAAVIEAPTGGTSRQLFPWEKPPKQNLFDFRGRAPGPGAGPAHRGDVVAGYDDEADPDMPSMVAGDPRVLRRPGQLPAAVDPGTTGTHDGGSDAPPFALPDEEGALKSYLAAAAGGMAYVDQEASPIMTFAQGFGGSMATREAREARKRAEYNAAEETAYQRGRDKRQDDREDREADMDEVKTAQDVLLTQAQTAKMNREIERLTDEYDLTPEEVDRAEDTVTARLNLLFGNNVRPPDPDEFFEAGKRIRREVYRELRGRAGVDTPEELPEEQLNITGTGTTKEDPIVYGGGAREAFKAELDRRLAANGGKTIYFKNPANGAILPYDGKP